MTKLVREIMTPFHELKILQAVDSVEIARQHFNQFGINCVLYLSRSGRPNEWYIFTSDDLVYAMNTAGFNLTKSPLSRYGNRVRDFADPTWTCEELINFIMETGHDHLLVAENGLVIGLVTKRDAFKKC